MIFSERRFPETRMGERMFKTMALTKEKESRVKRRRPLRWLICVILTVLLFCPALVSGKSTPGKGPLTNVAFMEKATSAAVDSLIRVLPFPLRGPVRLKAVTTHDATWMIESLFGGRLREKGVQVMITEVPSFGATVATLVTDTTGVTDSSRVSAVTQNETEGLTLEYRIAELDMEYPRAWRPLYVGRKNVERVAVASLYGRLIDESSGKLLWVGQGSATERDVVPASKLSFLEGKSQDWQKGTLPTGKTSALVEPLVVAAIVAGLVYLFYSNKE